MAKKQSFTLIEALASFALIALLVSMVFGFYFHRVRGEKKSKDQIDFAIELSRVQALLNESLAKAIPSVSSPLSVEKGQISFFFHNGIEEDPAFCEGVWALLQLESAPNRLESKIFSITLFSMKEWGKKRVIHLCKGIQKLRIFTWEKRKWKEVTLLQIDQPPSMIKLHLCFAKDRVIELKYNCAYADPMFVKGEK